MSPVFPGWGTSRVPGYPALTRPHGGCRWRKTAVLPCYFLGGRPGRHGNFFDRTLLTWLAPAAGSTYRAWQKEAAWTKLMSQTYLAAVAARAIDAVAQQRVPTWDAAVPEDIVPVDPANSWRGGIIEVESFFKATSTAVGSQCVVMSDDGDTFFIRAYEGDDEKVGVYSVKSGPLRSFAAHTDVISALSLDGDRLASASTDGTARLWEVSSGTCFACADVGEVLRSVHLAGNFLVTGDAGNKAVMWRLGSADDTSGRTWKGHRRNDDDRNEDELIAVEVALPRLGSVTHRGTVYGCGVTSAGVACSVGWNSNDLKIWNSAGAVLHNVTTPANAGFALVLNGDSIFIGLRSGHVATYSISTGAMTQIFAANSAKREVSARHTHHTYHTHRTHHTLRPSALRTRLSSLP